MRGRLAVEQREYLEKVHEIKLRLFDMEAFPRGGLTLLLVGLVGARPDQNLLGDQLAGG